MRLVLVLTDECNRRCRYCYANARRAAPMTVDVGRRALRLALGRRPASLDVGFFGGEPLLRFGLLRELTDYACAHANGTLNLTFQLSTNGDALDREIAQYLASRGFSVALSAHDDDPAAVRTALRLLAATGLEPRVVLVADPGAAAGLTRNVGALATAGVRRIGISPDYYAAWDRHARARLTAAYHGLAALYRRRLAGSHPLRISLFDLRIKALRNGVALRETHCRLGRSMMVVAPDGTIFPCDRMAVDACSSALAIGHVLTGVDYTKWDRIAAERRRQPEKCRGCRYRAVCTHFCACVNVRLAGNVCAAPEIVCWHESLLGDIVLGLVGELENGGAFWHVRRRRSLVRVTAGLVVAAGSLSVSCRDEAPTTPVAEKPAPLAAVQTRPSAPIWVDYSEGGALEFPDKTGVRCVVRLRLQTDLPRVALRDLLRDHRDEINRILETSVAQVEAGSLADPANEEQFGRNLLRSISTTLGGAGELRDVALYVLPRREIDAELIERLRTLGYVSDDP